VIHLVSVLNIVLENVSMNGFSWVIIYLIISSDCKMLEA